MSPEGTTIRVAVVGATGELGSAATALLERTGGFTVVAALGSASDWADMLGTAEDPSEVVLDVTLPHVSPDVVDYALTRGRDVVVGTTGWTAEKLATLTPLLEAHPERGVIVVPNFAAGAALATAFAATASRFFDAIEIIEAHGPGKLDSPSGTATRIAEQIHAARDDLGMMSFSAVRARRSRSATTCSAPAPEPTRPGSSSPSGKPSAIADYSSDSTLFLASARVDPALAAQKLPGRCRPAEALHRPGCAPCPGS